ncbi:PilW family protein [Aeromonas allosaccharophila]|uniref:PilW family protein n=1 Tax=Aeromonas allosaccharophila TaxID=656 RepID=UPI0011167A82|nr:PilW family protein [Aeromonas allosaccharophila]TNI93352.1 pilus assembly protein PilW [Aeromonas allosaccharophila]
MKNLGFTLIEWLIAMVIGIFLLGGVLSIFVASRSTSEDSFDQSELQENGRLAMRLIAQDLKWAGFWGDYTGMPMQLNSGVTATAGAVVTLAKDCLDERNEGSLPSTSAPVRGLWAVHVDSNKLTTGNAFNCISSANRVANTDIISIKRLIGFPLADSALVANRFYMATTPQSAVIFRGNETPPDNTAMPNRQLWEYQHYIYSITDNNGVPELHKRMLTANDGSWDISGALAQGIEKMVILYGVDTSVVQDGRIDKYSDISSVSSSEWNEGRVIAARLFILVRSLQRSNKHVNNNVYQVGNIQVSGSGDGFRRLLLETSVALRNPAAVAGGGK